MTSITSQTPDPGGEGYLQLALAIYRETVGETAPQYTNTLSLLASLTTDRRSAQAIRQRAEELTKPSRGRNPFRDLQDLRAEAMRYESARANDKAEAALTRRWSCARRTGARKTPSTR